MARTTYIDSDGNALSVNTDASTYSESNPVKPNHYDMPITPIEYIERNGLGFSEGKVVKYVSRHRQKNGAEDLKKAMMYIKYILKFEYGEE